MPAAAAQTMPAADHGWSFRAVLSALNPLQYLPVVGTIYRAVTGDVIPEVMQRLGSMLVSGLAGGPIGLAINIGTTLIEKATGIDPDKMITDHFNPTSKSAGMPTQIAADPPVADSSMSAPTSAAFAQPLRAWTREQLAAYGVTTNTTGNLTLGSIEGADVLNAIQLSTLSRAAAAAYAANRPVSPGLAAHPA